MKRLLLAIGCLAVLAVRLAASEVRLVPYQRVGIASDEIGVANIVLADLTGDGRPEIVSCSAGSPLALTHAGGTYVSAWHGRSENCNAVTAGDANGDGVTDVIMTNTIVSTSGSSAGGGKILIFDPRGLAPARTTITLPGTRQGIDIAFGNVDFDAGPEIVAITDNATYVYDAATAALQWTFEGHGGSDVELADVDGDARLEIVVNGSSAAVLDGGNNVLKWGYVGGFGAQMSLGNVDADAKAEIVFPGGDYYRQEIVILHGDTFAITRVPSSYGSPIAVGDANGDGVNEVITDFGYSGLRGVRPSDGALVWSLASPASGVFGLALGDVDGDGERELVWGGGTSSSEDKLIVGNVITQTIEHQGLDLDGPLHSATGDVDGDGRPDLVIASNASRSGYDGGIVQIVDPRSGNVKRAMSLTGLNGFDIYRVAIGQLDSDPATEIVALGASWYDPLLVVWDATTSQVEWKSTVAPYGSATFLLTVLAVANLDGDATDEIVLAMSDQKLVVLNGASNIIQSSKTLTGNLVDLQLANLDGDAALEAVAGTGSVLYLLDTADWSITRETPLANIKGVTATAAEGGRVAVGFLESSAYPRVQLYDLELTPFWKCELAYSYDYYSNLVPRFVRTGSETQLFAARSSGTVVRYPIAGGNTCPTATSFAFSTRAVHGFHSVDVTGDGRPELVVDSNSSVEVDLIGLTSEPRGDTDGDSVITASDVDRLVDEVFGVAAGMLPGCDVNADQRVSAEDIFTLINYEFAGGPELQP